MSVISFTKMHGIGNDFVMIDARNAVFDPTGFATVIANRRFGVGCDQMIIARTPSSDEFDVRMEIINADGSVVEMCGNGIRCFAKWLYKHTGLHRETYNVETPAGLIRPTLLPDGMVRVDMGPADLRADHLPTNSKYFAADHELIDATLEIGNTQLQFCGVQVGNPHFVHFVDDVQSCEAERIGPLVESHAAFPNRINVEFAQRTDDGAIVRVWERGAGLTLACGTGATAVGAALFRTGFAGQQARIELPGGDLMIEEIDGHMFMTGDATEVFTGTLNEARLERDAKMLAELERRNA